MVVGSRSIAGQEVNPSRTGSEGGVEPGFEAGEVSMNARGASGTSGVGSARRGHGEVSEGTNNEGLDSLIGFLSVPYLCHMITPSMDRADPALGMEFPNRTLAVKSSFNNPIANYN